MNKLRVKKKPTKTHFEVGVKVRQTILELGGKMPEHLLVAQSIQKIEKKIN